MGTEIVCKLKLNLSIYIYSGLAVEVQGFNIAPSIVRKLKLNFRPRIVCELKLNFKVHAYLGLTVVD